MQNLKFIPVTIILYSNIFLNCHAINLSIYNISIIIKLLVWILNKI